MARVLLVVGSERSGTSLLVGILREIGWWVPQPEIEANEMNPRGFGETEWVVRFNTTVLEWANVHISDARPMSWRLIDDRETHPKLRRAMIDWLKRAIGDDGRDVVVKDPRLTWLYPSWREAVIAAGAEPCCVVATRTPAEVVASKLKVNPARGVAGGLAGWVNVNLRAEHVTRGDVRSFVDYHDVLADWQGEVSRMASDWGSSRSDAPSVDTIERVDSFMDLGLYRRRADLTALAAPDGLLEIAGDLWQLLRRSQRERTGLDREYDMLRDRFDGLYREAESLAESSIGAVHRRLERQVRRLQGQSAASDGDRDDQTAPRAMEPSS